MADKTTTYVKLGRNGEIIEREALTPADHVQFSGTGWARKDSAAGRRVTKPTKADATAAAEMPATSVAAHAAAATTPSASKSTEKS